MKHRASPWFLSGVASGVLIAWTLLPVGIRAQTPSPSPAPSKDELAALRALLPPQGHAMADVESHFAALWFAGERGNWPLADFLFNQTLSNLRWAVRIRPVRPTRAGDIDLQAILDAVEASALKDLKESIAARSSKDFGAAYRVAVDSCNACHQAVERPFLRVRVPISERPTMIDFDPAPSAARSR
jgi:hypothetical protein